MNVNRPSSPIPLQPLPHLPEAQEAETVRRENNAPSHGNSQSRIDFGHRPSVESAHTHAASSAHEARPASHAEGAATVTAEERAHQQHVEMDRFLTTCFSGLKGSTTSHHMQELINERTEILVRKGETLADVEAVFAKGKKLDRITTTTENAVRALPYAIPGYVANPLSKLASGWAGINPESFLGQGINGLFVGVTAQSLRALSDGIVNKHWEDTLWMAEDLSKIDSRVKPLFEEAKTLPGELLNAVKGGIGFDIRNAGAIGVAEFNNPKANEVYGALGTLGAGAISGNIQSNSQPMNLLARSDWEERYDALKNTTFSEQVVVGGIRRTGAAVEGLMSFEGWQNGLKNVVQLNQISEIATLGVGLGLVNLARFRVKEAMGSDPTTHVSIGMDQLTNTASAAVAYAAQGVAGVAANTIAKATDGLVKPAINSGTEFLANMASAGINRFRQRTRVQDPESGLSTAE